MVEALQSMPDHPDAYDERIRLRHRNRKTVRMDGCEVPGSCGLALVEASGKTWSEVKMPGYIERSSQHGGPQVRLRLCKWFEEMLEEEVAEAVVNKTRHPCAEEPAKKVKEMA